MIRTFELYDNDGIDDESWSGILAAVMAAMRSTYSTTTQAMPMQLVFGRDAIINTKFIADWDYIRQRKQNIILFLCHLTCMALSTDVMYCISKFVPPIV